MSSQKFEVNRNDLSNTRFTDIAALESLDLAKNQVVLSVDKFALTANNITYGVAGDMIGYWKFFPVSQDWGQIPVWGIGTVQSSKVDGVSPGDRYYGYYPMSSYLIVEPGNVTARGFTDGSAHRAELPPTYNQYARMTLENGFPPQFDDHQMVYRPLFTTAFVLDDFFADNEFFGAQSIILSSASSKTSFGLAYCLKRNRDIRIIGLTSSGNMDFVKHLGVYDDVVDYDNVSSLDKTAPVAFVDMAGNRRVLEQLHHHYQDNMKYSCGVGITHWDARDGQDPATLPGAKPAMFFAPSQMQKRNKEWGLERFQSELGSAWTGFLEVVDDWVTIDNVTGRQGLENTYQRVLKGAKPDTAFVLTL